jgi:hypothetical protein
MQRINSDVMDQVVLGLCEAIDTPRALATWLCFKYNHEALLGLPPVAVAESDSSRFQLEYFLHEYLSKYKGLKLSAKPREVALDRWRSAELLCRETNLRFRALQHRPFSGRVESTLFRAQRKIAAVLGRLDVATVLGDCKWGPGATFDIRRELATPDKKISQAISVTAAALPYLRRVVESDPHWSFCFLGEMPWGQFSLLPVNFKIVRGSRFLTVAKTAKTDRVIAAEPTGNSFLQQGVHGYLRRRLKRFGVDLDDQSINRKLAQDAYATGLSTLDLSMASDTITSELVYHLLPIHWAMFLDSLRSKETVDPLGSKEWVRTEKFASMGNAFCFELETLIFWALASSVAEVVEGHDRRVSVYGDDIIVPRGAFDSVVEILQVCGFTVNSKKSFKDGNFFESCGGHYHKGIDVTPVYQKELLNTPPELIRAHNRLIRLAARLLRNDRWFIVTKATRAVKASWPLRPFPRIPYGVSEDGGFLRPLQEFILDPNHGFRCRVLDYVPRLTGGREDAMYAYKLRRKLYQSPDPLGRGANTTKGSWRTRVRWVSEASTHDEKWAELRLV